MLVLFNILAFQLLQFDYMCSTGNIRVIHLIITRITFLPFLLFILSEPTDLHQGMTSTWDIPRKVLWKNTYLRSVKLKFYLKKSPNM